MSKILALANIDLKKNLKFYLFYCISLITTILALNIFYIYRILTTENILDDYINRIGGIFYGASVLSNNYIIHIVMIGGIILAIGYTFVLWINDFIGHNKSIYTLLMIPENRIKLYFSKLLNSMFFIYLVMASELLSIFLSKQIFNILLRNKSNIIDTSLNTDFSYLSEFKFFNTNLTDFLVENILYVFMVVSIISTVSLFIMSIKNKLFTVFTILIVAFVIVLPLINILDIYNIYNIFLDMGITDNIVVIKIILQIFISIISTLAAYLISKRKINI